MKAKTEQVKKWAEALSNEQLIALTVTLTKELMICEVVNFWDGGLAPYWDATGEPLVDGQKVFEDD